MATAATLVPALPNAPSSITGAYRREPVENGWHAGHIVIDTVADTPVDGSQGAVAAEDTGHDPTTSPHSSQQHGDTRVDVSIGGGSDGSHFTWVAAADGVAWSLSPTDHPDMWRTGDTNPYCDECDTFHLLRNAEGNVIGYCFCIGILLYTQTQT